jgi:hypothetical protein
MGVGVVFTGIMTVLRNGFVRGELFEPHIIVVMQSGLVVIDED